MITDEKEFIGKFPSLIDLREIKQVRGIVRDLGDPSSFFCGIVDCKKIENSARNQPVYGLGRFTDNFS